MLTARDIMSTEVASVTLDTSLKDLAGRFMETRYSNMPVVDATGKLVGVISETDLVEYQRPLHIPTVMTLFDGVFSWGSERKFKEEVDRVTATTVGDLYHENPVTCRPDTPVNELAGLMSKHKVHLLPVVENDKMIGVVARLDLIRVMED